MVSLGRGLGDDGRSMVSLEPETCGRPRSPPPGSTTSATRGGRSPSARLCASLDGEARLHLPGRIRTRGEIQLILQNRLRMVDLWKEEPAVLREPVHAPIVVTGLGRSGTTLLHELLACDPDNRPPLLWELLHTVPYDDASGDLCDDEITLMDEMVPAFTAMHENGGRLPTECIFAFAHQFSSDMYTGLYNVAEYTVWRSGQDQSPIYDWHKRHLQTLQWVAERPTPRWVVKAPSHLSALPLLFATYPDARVVITHRDPLRVIGSLADLMATLHYMHSDHVDHAVLVEFMAMGLEMQMDHVTAERDAGAVPRGPDRRRGLPGPGGGPRRGRSNGSTPGWDLPVTPEFRSRARGYLAARHTGRTGGHDYSFADTGLDLATHRALVGAVPGALRGSLGGLASTARRRMDWKLEVVAVPVADVDRAKAFYTDTVGFHLDVDHRAGEDFRVVQLTPPGSACSVVLMKNEQAAGSLQGLQLVVRDIEAAHRQLAENGVPRQ